MNSETFAPSVTVIAPRGRLDALAVPGLERELEDAISAGQVRVIMDLSDATYVCSSSLRVLLLALRKVRPLGGDILLCCVSPRIRMVLEVSGFDQVLELCDTEEAARDLFADHAERG